MYPEQKIAQFVCHFEHSIAVRLAHALYARRDTRRQPFPGPEIRPASCISNCRVLVRG
jgi:hypothetical protein